jgi:large subunit ribosomal protein L22
VAKVSDGTWSATHRFARISPYKARLVMGLVRGKMCAEAIEQLRFNTQRSARLIRDVLRSAMVNADEAEADVRRLYVSDGRVDGGPLYKRWQPKDRGRAHPILKRTSHIRITVAER